MCKHSKTASDPKVQSMFLMGAMKPGAMSVKGRIESVIQSFLVLLSCVSCICFDKKTSRHLRYSSFKVYTK